MKAVVDIHNVNSGKFFAGNKNFDTIAMKAKLMMANDLYYNNKLDEALVLFTEPFHYNGFSHTNTPRSIID